MRKYSGPVFPHSINRLGDLNTAMKWLVDLPPIPSAMEHGAPCSIGETVEAALGLPPSTRRIDLELEDASVEIKSDRISAATPKSEATSTLKSPDGLHFSGTSDSDRYRQFVEKYGWKSDGSGIAILSTGEKRKHRKGKNYYNRINLYHAVKPEPHKITDLYVEFDEEEDRIWVCHPKEGRILYYDQTNIDEIMDKYNFQYCPHAMPLTIEGAPHFDFQSVDALVTKLYPFTVQRFWEAIVSGEQDLEFRAHICDDIYCANAASRQCKPPGGLRCRGTAFRTPKKRIQTVWASKKIA